MSANDSKRTFEAQQVRFRGNEYYVSRQSARKVRNVCTVLTTNNATIVATATIKIKAPPIAIKWPTAFKVCSIGNAVIEVSYIGNPRRFKCVRLVNSVSKNNARAQLRWPRFRVA